MIACNRPLNGKPASLPDPTPRPHGRPPSGPTRLTMKVAGQFLAGGLLMVAVLEALARTTGLRWHAGVLGEGVQDALFVALGAGVLVLLLRRQARRDWPAPWTGASAHDPLTGLPDRAVLRDRLAALLAEPPPAALPGLVLVQVRSLEAVNETRGPAVGDALLQEVARRLDGSFGPPGGGAGTVARLHGDEFAVVLPDCGTAAEAAEAARKAGRTAVAVVSEPVTAAGQYLHVGARAGVALGEPEIADPGVWLQRADLALSHARTAAREPVQLYRPAFAEAARAEAQLETELRGALARGEFELAFEPKVALADRSLVGAEALLRWRHPTRGLLSPDVFLPVAERSGLIMPLGGWVLRRALEDAAAWPAAGGRAPEVAVNVSAVQLADEEFEAALDGALAASGLAPQQVTLELTEGTLLDDPALTGRLQALRARGVGLAVDDFGTGYSALAYLKRYPVTEIKVDRAFVHAILDDAYDDALVAAIVRLAGALSLPVTAEGVETEAQAQRLAALGCTYVQGYHYIEPLDGAGMARLLADRGRVPGAATPRPESPGPPEIVPTEGPERARDEADG